MHHDHPSKHTLLLFLIAVSLLVALLSCNPTATSTHAPTPDYVVSTVTALETELAHQAAQVAALHEAVSYLSTRVGALPASTPTTTPPTRTPVPSYPPTPTSTPMPVQSFPSPDGSRLAFIQDRGILVVEEADGQQRELLVTDEVSSLAWFPDGRYIVYSDHDLSQDVIARKDQLWIVNVETGESQQIGAGYAPHVSPDGRHIAVLSGVLWGGACLVGYDVAILELDDNMHLAASYRQDDFAGLPGEEDEKEEMASFHPVSTEDIETPGIISINRGKSQARRALPIFAMIW
jgi:dipeptidyl aminopeptidase/acylaminoacyl peptidase